MKKGDLRVAFFVFKSAPKNSLRKVRLTLKSRFGDRL